MPDKNLSKLLNRMQNQRESRDGVKLDSIKKIGESVPIQPPTSDHSGTGSDIEPVHNVEKLLTEIRDSLAYLAVDSDTYDGLYPYLIPVAANVASLVTIELSNERPYILITGVNGVPRNMMVYRGMDRAYPITPIAKGALASLVVPFTDSLSIDYATDTTAGEIFVYMSARPINVNNLGILGSGSGSGVAPVAGGQFAEDSPAASGDIGQFALGVRNTALATPTSTDGDYSQLSVGTIGQLLQVRGGALADGSSNTAGKFMDETGAGVGVQVFNYVFNGSTWDRQKSVPAFADANALVGATAVGNWLYNGTQWDRHQSIQDYAILSSAARTATTNSADQTNFNYQGFMFFLNVTANPGAAETLTLVVQEKDPLSGSYVDAYTSGVLITAANGTKLFIVHPGLVAADITAANSVQKSGLFARTFRIQVTHSAAGSWTYSVRGVALL